MARSVAQRSADLCIGDAIFFRDRLNGITGSKVADNHADRNAL